MMKWIIRFLLVLIVLISAYIINYWRLSVLPPAQIDYIQAVEANTIHNYGTAVLNPPDPKKVDLGPSFEWTRIDYEPYQGIHYVNLWRFFFGKFDINKPPIIVYNNQKLVSYVYVTDKPFGNFHWHYHKNICYMEGFVGTTQHDPLWCMSHGYIWWPFNKWHLHVWLNGQPDNDLWNTNIQ